MTNIIVHTRRPDIQEKVRYIHGFYVSADVSFLHFEDMKSVNK